MPDIPVEDAVKENCQAVLAGDLMRIMGDLTPEALGALMANAGGGGGMGAMPALTAFDIQDHEEQGDDHIFTVKFSGDQDFTAKATWRDVGGAWKIANLELVQMPGAREFMQGHADKAAAGKIAEIMGDLTPESMAQIGPLMAGAPNPATGNSVVPVSDNGDEHVFDVTYTGAGGASVSMRETVKQIDGKWRIVKLEKPA